MILNITFQEIEKRLDIEFKEIHELENRKRDQTKIVTPTEETQVLEADTNKLLSKVIVDPIPSEYVVPQGTLEITDTEVKDVTNYKNAIVIVENLEPQNILEGVSILGVVGSFNDALAQYVMGNLTEYESNVITQVVNYAFNQSGLTKVKLQNATRIGSYAFEKCIELVSVDIPNATYLGFYAFANCEKLTSINATNVTEIGQYAFNRCLALESIDLPKITTISVYAFAQCSNLKSVNFPNAIEVQSNAFRNSSALISINLPKCTKLSANAFEYSYITDFNLPNVETAGSRAFAYAQITTLSLPKLKTVEGNFVYMSTKLNTLYFASVEKINNAGFSYCYANNIYLGYEGVITLSNTNAFNNLFGGGTTSNKLTIHVRAEYADQYATATNWVSVIESGKVTIVGDYVE